MRFVPTIVSFLALSLAPALAAEIATPDDTAKFLAGLSPSSDSPLVAFTKDGGWQQHASRFDGLFGEEERSHLSRVRAFAKQQLSPHNTLLYMFSGPDALHALALFPNATTYVMAGLEPVGNMPARRGQVLFLWHSPPPHRPDGKSARGKPDGGVSGDGWPTAPSPHR
jgi:hypothetical protein